MATYDEKYGLMFEGQGNQNWGLTLHIPEKVPLTTNSIFDTYDHMMAYVNNPTSSAIPGLQLAVVGETGDNVSKNGLYLITVIGTKGEDGAALNNGVVVKLANAADVKGDAEQLEKEFDEFVSANTAAHTTFTNNITANASAITEINSTIEVVSGDVATNATNIATVSGTAADNASAIERIDGELVTVNANIQTNATNIATVSGTAADNADAIGDLQDDLAALQDEVSGLTEDLSQYKVKTVKADDKVLAVDANGELSSTITMNYDSEKKEIYLKGKDGGVISTVDATDFIKDGMLDNVELKTTGGKTELIFTFNTDAGKEQIPVDVTELLNGTELQNIQTALDTHTSSANTQHLTGDQIAYLNGVMPKYSVSQLDSKFTEITNEFTTNTDAHATFASEITSAKTRIDKTEADITILSGAIDTNASAITEINSELVTVKSDIQTNTANIATVSGTAADNAADIVALSDIVEENARVASAGLNDLQVNIDNVESALTQSIEAVGAEVDALEGVVDDLTTANTQAHQTLQDNIDAVDGKVTTLTERVAENERVVATSLTDLKKTKVSEISVAEGSNIALTENSNDEGITYQLDFQWLEF